MFNIGDKFTIEIENIINKDANGNKLDSPLYMMKGFNSLIFDDSGLSILTKNDTKSNKNNNNEPNENEWINRIGSTILGAAQIMKSEYVNGNKTEILKYYQIMPVHELSDKKFYDEIDNIDPELVFKYMSKRYCIKRNTIYRGKYDTVSIHINHHNPVNFSFKPFNSSYLLPICYDIETCEYLCTLIFNFGDYGANYDITVKPTYIFDNNTFAINITAIRSNVPSFKYSDILTVINTMIKI